MHNSKMKSKNKIKGERIQQNIYVCLAGQGAFWKNVGSRMRSG